MTGKVFYIIDKDNEVTDICSTKAEAERCIADDPNEVDYVIYGEIVSHTVAETTIQMPDEFATD